MANWHGGKKVAETFLKEKHGIFSTYTAKGEGVENLVTKRMSEGKAACVSV